MRAGQLRSRVTLEAVTHTDAPGGGRTEAWDEVATVWAAVEPLMGNERIQAMQVSTKLTHRITIRYREGVSTVKRARFRDQVFNIVSVANTESRDREMVLMAEEVT